MHHAEIIRCLSSFKEGRHKSSLVLLLMQACRGLACSTPLQVFNSCGSILLCRDGTSLDGATTAGGPYPTRDDAGHTLSTEFGLCQYRDHQVISVQVSLCCKSWD